MAKKGVIKERRRQREPWSKKGMVKESYGQRKAWSHHRFTIGGVIALCRLRNRTV
jgi:hypothetical protein